MANEETLNDKMICAANNAHLRQLILNTFQEKGLMGVYNLGLQHMQEYLEEDSHEQNKGVLQKQ